MGNGCQNPTGTEGECGFIEEKYIRADTLGPGCVWDLDTSTDTRQSCLYNADGTNQHVDTLDRLSLEILATFGRHGRYAGEFHCRPFSGLDCPSELPDSSKFAEPGTSADPPVFD